MSTRNGVRRVDDDDGAPDLDRIYREEAPRLARYFRRHRGGDEVPDLVQETFARLVAARLGMQCAKPTAYLQRIARNLLFDRSRRAATRAERFQVEVTEQLGLSTPADQDHAIHHDDTMRVYRSAVAALPSRTRDAFLLHRVDGLPYREIAYRLGVSVPTVQYHIERALVHIDRALDQA